MYMKIENISQYIITLQGGCRVGTLQGGCKVGTLQGGCRVLEF